jgi:hypothetical protein
MRDKSQYGDGAALPYSPKISEDDPVKNGAWKVYEDKNPQR